MSSKKRNSGIAKKLSGKFTRRLILALLTVNIFLLLIVSAAAGVFMEKNAARKIEEEALYATAASGVRLPEWLGKLFPSQTRSGFRDITVVRDESNPHRYTIMYTIYFYEEESGELKFISYELDSFIDYTASAFTALLIVEFFIVCARSGAARRTVKRILSPISQFTLAAGAVSETLHPDELTRLRGVLEGISGSALDTRLDIAGTSPELRDLASAINAMLERVSEAYEAQIRFVSDASHELRTPISVIQGYAGLLDRWGKHDGKVLQEGIDAIKYEADSMKELVERLLFLARGDSGKLEMRVSEFDLSELITETIDEYRIIDGEHDYATEVIVCPVTADRAQIKEVLRIFTDNAKKYTDRGGSITVKCGATEKNEQFFSVTDTGCGIAPEDLPKVFERFHRTDASRSRASGGAGLGLAIARRIIAASGGRIEATSRLGVGTRMTVIL